MNPSEWEETTPGLVAAPPSDVALREQSIGAILRRQTELSETQLEEALAEQARQPRKEANRLGEMLVRLRYVTEEQVIQALATQLGLIVLADLKPEEVDP